MISIGSKFLSLLRLTLALVIFSSTLLFAAVSGDVIEFRSDSPERYTVVKGDTLWDISDRFLEYPWLWPQVWEANPQIKNPHLIYPGDRIETIYVDGNRRLTINRGAGAGANSNGLTVVKLSPQVRRETILSPIPAISLDDIESFLSLNRIVGADELEKAARVIGSQEDQNYTIVDDVIYALGDWGPLSTTYDIVRPGAKIENSDGEAFAMEAILIGSATLLSKEGDKGTLKVDSSVEEVRLGDKVVASVASSLEPTFFPEAPSFEIDAEVMSIEFGKSYGGARDTVVVDVGSNDRIKAGHILTVQKAQHAVKDGTDTYIYSGEKFGRVLIYQVFDQYSLGLVLSSEKQINISDRAVTP